MPNVISDIHSAETRGLISIKRKDFAYQSYLDTALKERAILPQPSTAPIVPSTLTADGAPEVEQTSGYGIAAIPSNECPVAVSFLGTGAGSSATYVLPPGSMIVPSHAPFTAFKWGLPYGWLGGGSAAIAIMKDPAARVDWAKERPEILFHRFCTRIISTDVSPANLVQFNLPTRFPWLQAASSYLSGDYNIMAMQSGKPLVTVEPTRMVLRLRVVTPADPIGLRLVFVTTQFDIQNNAVITAGTNYAFCDVTFPGEGGIINAYAVTQVPDAFAKLGGDAAMLMIYDVTGTYTGDYVDVLRYGRIG